MARPRNIPRPTRHPNFYATAHNELEEEVEAYKRDLALYVRSAWPVIEPGTEYIHNWHIDAICEHLQAVFAGDIHRLIVNMPPRFMKSISIAVGWPTWGWILKPETRWLCASYALSLAIRDSRKSRQIVESQWYRQHFPYIKLADDQNAKARFENTHRGYRLAVSVDSAALGEGGDYIIIDDPHNAKNMGGVARQAALDWFDNVMATRLNDQKTGGIVIVMQRLHDRDLAGHLLAQGGWEHLKLPNEYEGNKTFTSIGWSDPRKEEGELLWPERLGEAETNSMKGLGSFRYASQFQQRPVPAEGGKIKKEWLHYFRLERVSGMTRYILMLPDGTTKAIDAKDCTHFFTVDVALTTKSTSDYTVLGMWAMTKDKNLLLLDVLRKRMETPEQLQSIKEIFYAYRPAYGLVESVAFQLSVVQMLLADGIPVRPYYPPKNSDKAARMTTAAVFYEAGKMWHLFQASWLAEVEHELLTFPVAEHDDVCDMVSIAAEELPNIYQGTIRTLDYEDADIDDDF